MVKGIYSAASGMMAEMVRTDVIANNLANVNTTGFKKDTAVEETFRDMLVKKIEANESPSDVGGVGTGVDVVEIRPIMSTGMHKLTGHKLDVALQGDGFFVVNTAQGDRYTRDGAFAINEEGYLVNVDGDYIMGDNTGDRNGRIHLTQEEADVINIGTDGNIRTANGRDVGKLRIVKFDDQNDVLKLGDNLWVSEARPTPVTRETKVYQGELEYSNVNVVSEMIDLITATRAYEMNQKMIQMQDATLDKAINSVGNPS